MMENTKPYCRERYVSLGHRRRLWIATAGSGPPLLLIHGKTCDHSDWSHQLQDLACAYHMIAPDLAFHGQSDPDPEGHGLRSHARDCLALLDAMKIPSAVVIGHSMGAGVARELYHMAPQRVDGIVIVDSRGALPVLFKLPRGEKNYPSVFNLNRLERFEAQRRRLEDQLAGYASHDQPPEPEGRWCGVPLLAFFSSRGAVCDPECIQRVESELSSSDGRLIVVSDSGHWIMSEQHAIFNRELLRFLRTLYKDKPCTGHPACGDDVESESRPPQDP